MATQGNNIAGGIAVLVVILLVIGLGVYWNSSKQKSYKDPTEEIAYKQCASLIKLHLGDSEAYVPPVKNFGENNEFFFGWGGLIIQSNGKKASASCIWDAVLGKVKMLSINSLV